MITRLKLSTIEQGLPKYRSMLAGNDAYKPSSYESISSTTLGSNTTTVTFSSIPQTYSSLQLRIFAKNTEVGGPFTCDLSINEVIGTSSVYASHYLQGTGTAAQAAAIAPNYTWIEFGKIDNTQSACFILDFHDYTSTTRNKTVRCFYGYDQNGSGRVGVTSGMKNSTSAITSINLYVNQGSVNQWSSGSTFALYGVKGA